MHHEHQQLRVSFVLGTKMSILKRSLWHQVRQSVLTSESILYHILTRTIRQEAMCAARASHISPILVNQNNLLRSLLRCRIKLLRSLLRCRIKLLRNILKYRNNRLLNLLFHQKILLNRWLRCPIPRKAGRKLKYQKRPPASIKLFQLQLSVVFTKIRPCIMAIDYPERSYKKLRKKL